MNRQIKPWFHVANCITWFLTRKKWFLFKEKKLCSSKSVFKESISYRIPCPAFPCYQHLLSFPPSSAAHPHLPVDPGGGGSTVTPALLQLGAACGLLLSALSPQMLPTILEARAEGGTYLPPPLQARTALGPFPQNLSKPQLGGNGQGRGTHPLPLLFSAGVGEEWL